MLIAIPVLPCFGVNVLSDDLPAKIVKLPVDFRKLKNFAKDVVMKKKNEPVWFFDKLKAASLQLLQWETALLLAKPMNVLLHFNHRINYYS